jgi:hypothetical protein
MQPPELLDPGARVVQVARHHAPAHDAEPHLGQKHEHYLRIAELDQRANLAFPPHLQGLRRNSTRRFLHLVDPLDAQDLSIRSRNGAHLLRNLVSASRNLSECAKQCFHCFY